MQNIFKYLLITALLLPVVQIPLTKANTSADFARLVLVSEDIPPAERFARKVSVTTDALKKAHERVLDMSAKLDALTFEDDSSEKAALDLLKTKAQGYLVFYSDQLLQVSEAKSIEDVDLIIDEIISYRESTYSAGAREILEFILVYSYTPSVLTLAENRLQNIRTDVRRLENLDLIRRGEFTEKITELEKTLQEARALHEQAKESLMQDRTMALSISGDEPQPAATTPKELAEGSLQKIKRLYELFVATGEQVGRIIGLN